MRVGREFQTTVDSSEEEEVEDRGERESIQGGEMQQARNSATDDGETKTCSLSFSKVFGKRQLISCVASSRITL